MQIVKYGRICVGFRDESIVVFDKMQATVYQMYGYPNKQPLQKMRNIIMKTSPGESLTWVDILSIASECGVRGYGTKIAPEWKNAF